MKLLTAIALSLALLASAHAQANQAKAPLGSDAPSTTSSQGSQTITLTRSGSQPSSKGPAEYFTGAVRIDPLYQAPAPARMFAASV